MVSALTHIYTEPQTDSEAAHPDRSGRDAGFAMGFAARILPLRLQPAMVEPLLERAKRIVERDAPPAGREGCKDCERLAGVVELVARPGSGA